MLTIWLWTGHAINIGFEGHLLTGDEYRIVFSAKVVSTETGNVVLRVTQHEMIKRLSTKKDKDAAMYFYDLVLPQAAQYLAGRIVRAIRSRQ